jgi:Tol biopolymer transport system component
MSPAEPTATPTLMASPTPLPDFCLSAEPVAQPTPAAPAISPISFAANSDGSGWPLRPTLQFTGSITQVQAFFGYTGMTNGLAWERVWLFGDQELTRGQGSWDAGPQGQLTVHVAATAEGFVPGRYFLELYVEDQLLSKGSFLIVDPLTSTQRSVQVAYTTLNTDTVQLNLLNLDNDETQPLLAGGISPTWSRNGIDLMFYSPGGVEGGSRGIWVRNLRRQENVQVIAEPFSKPIAWSPDGIHVATFVVKEGRPNLVLWNVATRQAVNGPPGETPGWSPEGRRLAYRGCTAEGWNISIIEIIGDSFVYDSLRRLTSGDDSLPSWSWDSQQIAFVRNEAGNQDIYVINVDGSNLTRLTEDPAVDTFPAWTPDGRLLFRSLREDGWGIYLMEADGSDQRRLLEATSEASWEADPLAVSTDIQLIEPTSTPKPQPKVHVPAGRGILVVSNVENNDEMTFTINNQEHKVPPYQYRNISLPPGNYTWTASWPAKVSRTGRANIVIGQVSYPIVER